MYHNIPPEYFFPLWGAFAGVVLPLLIALVVWELFWKGLALWHAARNREIVWFIIFLFVHTAGILEIIYLVWFRADKDTLTLFDQPKHASAKPNTPAPDSSSAQA